MKEVCCPKCGECENIHVNYDYYQKHRPVEELLGTISTGKTVNTYVGNTAVRYVPFEDEVEIFAKTSSFKLSRKQIVKIKKKLI